MTLRARIGPRRKALALVLALGAAAFIGGGTAVPAAGTAPEEPLLLPDRIKADAVVILAHPDDEGAVAPLLARWTLEEGRRVINLYLTSGESGANRVGHVKGPAFGYLRLTELHWTLDRLGVAMFHSLGRSDRGRADDPAAALAGWDRERTVRELTRHLRLTRPERVLAWFPGPAASHAGHMAAGAAALLACRAAGSPEAFPEQMATEGLRPYAIPTVLLFAQAEKIAYSKYPSPSGPQADGPPVEEIPVNVFSPALGRRYTDVAREALREQRSVSAAANLGRGGAFDEPLRLIHALDDARGAAGRDAPAGVRIQIVATGAQRFLEEIAAEAGFSRIVGAYLPEAAVVPGRGTEIAFRITNGTASPIEKTRAVLELPEGWRGRPARHEVTLAPGESAVLTWTVEAPAGPGPLYTVASCLLEGAKAKAALATAGLVLRRTAAP